MPWTTDDVLEAAAGLLGWRLESEIGGRRVVVELIEVEAYDGAGDPASHAFRGQSPRNRVMFGPAGHLYVYRSYGIHWCMNVVTGPEGVAQAVLLRGGVVVAGESTVIERRRRRDHLTDGPGKLAQALAVTGDLDGHHLATAPLRLTPPTRRVATAVRTPRIGVSRAADRDWRFVAVAWED